MEKNIQTWAEKTKAALEEVKKAGVKIVTPDRGPFTAKVQAMLKDHEGTPIGDLLKRIGETR